jgi:N-acetylmuramoyl-L-alanine amidase
MPMIPKRIILHHSLTADSQTVSWSAIRKWHTGLIGQGDPNKPNYNYYANNPMDDIGYHFGIELVGDRYEVLVGRMLNEVGAHTQGQNGDSIGICFIGNFDASEIPPEQWSLGVRLVAGLCGAVGIYTDMIFGHNSFAAKSCPGLKFNVEAFAEHVEGRL